jgi:hypothetical protein
LIEKQQKLKENKKENKKEDEMFSWANTSYRTE